VLLRSLKGVSESEEGLKFKLIATNEPEEEDGLTQIRNFINFFIAKKNGELWGGFEHLLSHISL
jgi:hypothetical protein